MCFRPSLGKSAYLSASDDTNVLHGVVCLELLDIDAGVRHVKQAAQAARWLAGLVPPILP